LWRNINHPYWNSFFSKIACFIVFLQPLVAIQIIPEHSVMHRIFMGLYLLFYLFITLLVFAYGKIEMKTSIGKNGHLSWDWMKYHRYQNSIVFIYLSFYSIFILLTKNPVLILFYFLTLLLSLFLFYTTNEYASMWCWMVNIFMIYFIVDILLIQPYYEYRGLC
jgi:hypothetical protein